MDESGITQWSIQKYHATDVTDQLDWVVEESPVTVIVNGEAFATLLCSPTHLPELVTGFLASEGVIQEAAEIETITFNDAQGFAYVALSKPLPDVIDYSKRVVGSCCGKSRQFYFQNDAKTAKTIMRSTNVSVQTCYALMAQLQKRSETFALTGGMHNAALAVDNLKVVRSDIGRHNALDKIYGYLLNHNLRRHQAVIVFSGRISSEVLLKISKMGIGMIISKSAPSHLALKLADDLNITIVGFVRDNKLNVYTHQERINGSSKG